MDQINNEYDMAWLKSKKTVSLTVSLVPYLCIL